MKNYTCEPKYELTLPLKHKKDIIGFCKRYEELAKYRKIEVTIPAYKAKIYVSWQLDWEVTVDDENNVLNPTYENRIKEINKINEKIKQFGMDVKQWGKKHFDDTEWLWDRVFWHYCPSSGDTMRNALKITWNKNYENI